MYLSSAAQSCCFPPLLGTACPGSAPVKSLAGFFACTIGAGFTLGFFLGFALGFLFLLFGLYFSSFNSRLMGSRGSSTVHSLRSLFLSLIEQVLHPVVNFRVLSMSRPQPAQVRSMPWSYGFPFRR